MKYYVGIDLGGTNVVSAVVGEDFKIRAKCSCKTNLPKSPKVLSDDIANLVHRTLKKSGLTMNDIQSIGVGIPGTINTRSKIIEYSCNFNYKNVHIAQMLGSRLKKSVYIDNDANAAALGEFICGAGRGYHTIIVITLGTGVGGGVILNNKIYHGFNFNGGEIGHIVLRKDGRRCNCGRAGCFETYASATGIIRTAMEVMDGFRDSKMWDIYNKNHKINAKNVFNCAALGDKAAKKVVEMFISDLAAGLVNVVNIFQPQVLCIGGGVSMVGKLLIEPLQEIFDKEDYARNSRNRCKIISARLGNDAGLIGAAMLFKFQ